MTKQILLLALLLGACSVHLFANTFCTPDSLPKQNELQVVYIKGKVSLQSSGKPLKKNDYFRAGEPLKFAESAHRMVTMNHKRNLFIALPDARKPVGYLLEPIKLAANVRPGKIMNYLGFQKYLEGRRLVAIGDKLSLEIAGNELEMNEDKFFYIQYQWTGDTKPVNKQLAFSGQNLIIDKTTLFMVDGQPIDPAETSAFKLFYYDKPANQSTLINTVDLVFVELDDLYKEVNAIVELLGPNTKKSDLKDAILQYIHTQYGEPLKNDIDTWLKQNWGL
ncbi:MAG: hypothetical protein HUU34_06605 [Saprospiraceae bacterium]|nr:hypothetical protein [Saprospiraceae bacterium]